VRLGNQSWRSVLACVYGDPSWRCVLATGMVRKWISGLDFQGSEGMCRIYRNPGETLGVLEIIMKLSRTPGDFTSHGSSM